MWSHLLRISYPSNYCISATPTCYLFTKAYGNNNDVLWYVVVPVSSDLWVKKSKNIQSDCFLTSALLLSSMALLFDLFTKHPTCCCGPGLWSQSDVQHSEFVGQSDDSNTLLRDFYVPTKINTGESSLALWQHTLAIALTERLRLNTKDGQDPPFSDQNTVRVEGWGGRSQPTFIPVT